MGDNIPQSMIAATEPPLPVQDVTQGQPQVMQYAWLGNGEGDSIDIPTQEAPPQPAAPSAMALEFPDVKASELAKMPAWKQAVYKNRDTLSQANQEQVMSFIFGEMTKENDDLRKKADPKYRAELEAADLAKQKAGIELKQKEKELVEQASQANDLLNKVLSIKQDVKRGIVGPWQDVAQAFDSTGLPGSSEDNYKKRFALQTQTKQSIIDAVAAFKGPLSDSDRKFFTEMFPSIKDPKPVWDDYFEFAEKKLSRLATPASESQEAKPSGQKKALDPNTQYQIFLKAGRDPMKARQLEIEAGY